jgi:hypothetical protein
MEGLKRREFPLESELVKKVRCTVTIQKLLLRHWLSLTCKKILRT